VNGQVKITGGTPGLDKVLTSDATGLASWTSKNQVCPGTGYNNTCNSSGALFSNTTGFGNTAYGVDSLLSNTDGYLNTAIGSNSLRSNTSGIFNTAFGEGSLYSNTTGTENSAVGFYSLGSNTSGIANISMGSNALAFNKDGSYNIAYGSYSLGSNITGSDNVAIGTNALSSITTGIGNIALGSFAGGALTSGNNNIAIGYYMALPLSTGSNQLNIGNLIYGTDMTGGGAGNIGIGTATPNAKLEVMGDITANGAMVASNSKFIVSDDFWGIKTNFTSGWSMVTKGYGYLNSNPQDVNGSIYVNDVYIRSINKWASQTGSNKAWTTVVQCGGTTVGCPSGWTQFDQFTSYAGLSNCGVQTHTVCSKNY
ncbi:hypothetical protein H7169_03460, partial [Candidatus Gracilibacteria bacterium]|nr:hypothetical protein [Candidatus Gracilibacteria bacterium]